MKLVTGFLTILLLTGAGTLVGAEMRGFLVFGHEVRTLQLCGDVRVFWVQVPGALRQQLETQYRRLATRPYEALYAELEGEFSERAASGFAADYDGTILVREVRSVSRNGIETCGAGHPETGPESAMAKQAATYVFECDEQTAYTVRTNESKAWIFHPQGTLMLPAVSARQGRRYTDGAFELWIDGQQAQLGEFGTRITAHFGDDGRVTGSAGCNQYFADYRGGDGSIVIGQPGATRRFE